MGTRGDLLLSLDFWKMSKLKKEGNVPNIDPNILSSILNTVRLSVKIF
jgi:hypothetical protein